MAFAELENIVGDTMAFVRLGHSGLKVSRICLGTMNFGNPDWGCDKKTARRIVDRYLERGHNFIDTADSYGRQGESERILGYLLPGRRQKVVLATKCFWRMGDGPNDHGLSRKHIVEAVDASLTRLQTDWIDLLYVHIWDPVTPLEETMGTLDNLIGQGKVRYIGCSDFTGWQVSEAAACAREQDWENYICHQVEYSVLVRDIEAEIAPACRYNGIGLVAWSPLAGGMLTGKYKWGQPSPRGSRFAGGEAGRWWGERWATEENFRAVEEFLKIAGQMEVSPVSLAIAYSLLPDGIDVTIVGPKHEDQLEVNLAGEELAIPDEIRERLDALRPPPKLFPLKMQEEARAIREES
jgi:aryl-alcohol dehydrogenase-like predicted oxidoreductase